VEAGVAEGEGDRGFGGGEGGSWHCGLVEGERRGLERGLDGVRDEMKRDGSR
jgi:hypothetical protein